MNATYSFINDGSAQKSDIIEDVIHPFNGNSCGTYYRPASDTLTTLPDVIARGAAAMKKCPAWQRSAMLEKSAAIMKKRKDKLSRLLALEAGKPIRHALKEVERAINTLTVSSREALHIKGETIPFDTVPAGTGRRGIVQRFPRGAVFGITPFNFPLNLVCHKVGPALAAGNSITVKPASATPLSALELGAILLEAGAPDGACNVLPMTAAEAESFVKGPHFNLVTFTGSAEAGWRLKQLAGKKHVSLELGGNAAVVVDRDCPDLDFAVKRIILGSYAYAGQVCISVQRICVHRDIYDDFKARCIERIESLTIGDPLAPETDVGPMINESEAVRTETWIAEAVKSGGKIATGGSRNGTIVTPCLLENVPAHTRVWAEEVFAPVAVLRSFDTFEEGLNLVNDSRFGLQAGVFTRDLNKAFAAYDRIEAGGVIINDIPTYRLDHMPYGGIKDSGFGREGVKYAIEEMTELKLMVINSDTAG